MNKWVYRGVSVAIGIALVVDPHTRGLGILILVVSVAMWIWARNAVRSGSLGPSEYALTYDANAHKTYKALTAAVKQLGYRVVSSDVREGEVVFNTGMSMKTWAGQDFTASVRAESPVASEVRLVGATSQRGLGGIQSFSWGETERLANRVLDRITRELGTADN